MDETAEARLKRMAMRSWRRGTKEMDLVLGPFADTHLAGLSEEDKQSLLRDFVKEQGRIRNASTDERLKTACFAR